MMEGKISGLREAVIRLNISGPECSQEIEAVLDTGFNGFLTLTRPVGQALGLLARGSRRATLADGSIVALDVYRATVQWNGQKRRVLVLQAEGGSLVGMSLLYGNRVVLDVVEGGDVLIEPLPRTH
jgi:clan AA aspartic protease